MCEEVTSFTYIGFEVTNDGKDVKGVKTCIALGRGAINKKLNLLRAKVLSMKNKIKLVETYIYPIVRYGIEAASWSKALTSKVEAHQNVIMRRLTGYSKVDKVRIDKLKETSKLKTLFV